MTEAILEETSEDARTLDLYELPKGWAWGDIATVGEFCKNAIVDGPFGSNLKVSDYVEDGPVPVLTTRNLDGTLDGVRYISEEKFRELERSAVRPNDILMAKIGSCGKVGIYPTDGPVAMIPANLLKVSLNRHFCLYYVYYFFTSSFFRKALGTIIKATAQPAFGVTNFKRLPLPIAPEGEQSRIVSKIDELFSEIEEGERALERVQKLVERYRQSVLKAAVTGELTREWREKHKGQLEPGEAFLARILKARREAWENSELEKMKAKGQKPANNWKTKYKEPISPDTTNLPELPEGWVWASFDQLSIRITKGSSPNWQGFEYRTEGLPFIRSQNIRWGFLDLADVAYLDYGFNEVETKSIIMAGDVLLNIVGASIGRTAVATKQIEGANTNQAVANIRPVLLELSEFLKLCLLSSFSQKQIHSVKVDVARANFNLNQIQELACPLPPLAEMRQASDRVASTESTSQKLAAVAESESGRVGALRSAVLHAAFSGHLIPQDSTDEPASVLLRRIAAERDQNKTEAASKATRRKKVPA